MLVHQLDNGLHKRAGQAPTNFALSLPPIQSDLAREMLKEPRDAGLLGRETKGEVVLVSRLRLALERLNPALPPEANPAAVDELTCDRSAISPFLEAGGLVENGRFHQKWYFRHPVKH